MNTITVTICGQQQQIDADWSLGQTIKAFTPYGDEAVICTLNDTTVRSIDELNGTPMHNGDILEIYPLIIGG